MSPPQFKEKFAEHAELSDVESPTFISTNSPLKGGCILTTAVIVTGL